MYASQTKRLCVRETQSDENRVQHQNSSSTDNTTGLVNQTAASSSSQSTTAPISSSPQNIPQVQKQPEPTSLTLLTNSEAGDALIGVSGSAVVLARSQENYNTMTASTTGKQAGDKNEIPRKIPSAATMGSIYHHNERNSTLATAPLQQQATNANHDCENSHDATEHELINKLANESCEEAKLELILSIRNLITACNKKKDSLVNNPDFYKLVSLIDDDLSTLRVKTQLALLFCSIAKGGENNIKILCDLLVDSKILNIMTSSQDNALVEACLRCMRSIVAWPNFSRTSLLYGGSPTSNGVQHHDSKETNENDLGSSKTLIILNYAKTSKSNIVQECVADIFAATCAKNRDQVLLYRLGTIPCISEMLESPSRKVIISALNWLTAICSKNITVSLEAMSAVCPSRLPLTDRIIKMMSKDECYELQFLSARCFTQIYRALAPEYMKEDSRITSHVLPALVRMVHNDKPAQLRAKAAECIAYLIECETRLQNIASICDHLIESLANMLEQDQAMAISDLRSRSQIHYGYRCSRGRGTVWRSVPFSSQQSPPSPLSLESSNSQFESTKIDSVSSGNNLELTQEMRRSAFLALAALASHLEPIRKRIFNTCTVMQHLVKSLTDSDTKILKAVLTCLLSLSRSVQQLRTSFAENSVYSALKNLLGTSSNDVLILVLAVLCNLSLDFSPGKQHFLDTTTIGTLCSFTRGTDPFLRLHGMWILMNMVYQSKDQGLKFQILRTLGPEHLLNILENESDEELILKSLGLLRNLLSQRPHIDAIMSNNGEQIMSSLIRVLERPCSARIKEQTLCVLTNIADGTDSKSLIMSNRAVLSYLARTMSDEQAGDMRLAAICCITNLAHKEQDGSYERRDEMKKFGIEERLKSMLNTNDPILSNRVRTAYSQFLIGVEDKYLNW